MAAPTTTPTAVAVPSKEPQDLLFNAELQDILTTGTQDTAVDRLGRERLTWTGVTTRTTGLAPIAYAAGIVFSATDADRIKTIERSGIVYAPLPSALPFTTSGTWTGSDDARFRVIQGVTSADLALPGASGVIGWIQSGIGTIKRWLQDKLRERKTPEDFGAAGTELVDDTAAVQRSIDDWAANGRRTAIELVGRYRIDGTLRVQNLETDNPETRLVFTGSGTLVKNNAGFMFDKVPGQGAVIGGVFTELQTGHIYFRGTRFEGDNLLGQTFIINGDNIIRAHFIGCFGTKINIAKATDYLQTIYCTSGTTWRKWRGYLFECARLYDVKWDGVAEAGDAFLITSDASADPACNSLKVTGNIEGLVGFSGPAIRTGVCYASSFKDLYCEANAGGDLDLSGGTGFHKGLVIESCGFQPNTAQLADANYYPVKTGKGAVDGISLIGNASTHNLFDVDAGNQSAILDSGNYVPSGKNKFSPGSPRLFKFEGFKFITQLLPGFGVFLDTLNSSIGFANTTSTVSGQSVAAEILFGATNPQTSPGDYGNRVWQKGSIVFATTPVNADRQYGADVRSSAIIGWRCLAAGQPGTWQEIAIMRPY